MKSTGFLQLGVVLLCLTQMVQGATQDILTVSYPASTGVGGLSMSVEFHLWIPPGVKKIKAVIVHQHGCGDGAENSGETAALDLHWRALAERNQSALLSPHYHANGANCRLWCDPRNGSDGAFLRALDDLGQKSGHAELSAAPWCLWGHSGGGFWASIMLALHPERIVAIVCRSGSGIIAWEKGEIPQPEYSPASFGVPVLMNPGLKERGDRQFDGAWNTCWRQFEFLRSHDAPVAFAPDPHSSHECRNSRLVAIPFLDARLRQRIGPAGSPLKPVKRQDSFWGDWKTGEISRTSSPTAEQSWLPDAVSAKAFSQYVTNGITSDSTPPEHAPKITLAARLAGSSGVLLEWTAQADFESGIREFRIYRDGQPVRRLPEIANDRMGFAQFQPLSYHDTPIPNPPALRFQEEIPPDGKAHSYTISTVNGAGLEGPKSNPVRIQ